MKRSRASASIGIVLVGFVVLVAAVVLLFSPGGDAKASLPEGAPADAQRSASRTEGPRVEAASEPEERSSAAAANPERSWSLVCSSARDGSPLSGASLHAGLELVAGPSGDDGRLEPGTRPRGVLTVWCPSWVPQTIPPGAEPREVRLEPADASVLVELVNAVPEQRVLRSLLQPLDRPATGKEPWHPVLRSIAYDRLSAEDVPPGEYDVYVWVSGPEGVKPLSAPRSRFTAGETTTLRIDVSVPPEPEPDS